MTWSLLSSVQGGRTPLILASQFGHVAVAEVLLQANADVSICDEVCKLLRKYKFIYRITHRVL